jgi:hypothetical protein
MSRACIMHRKKRNAYKVVLGKREIKRPLGRPRSRWKNDIKMDLRERGRGHIDWIYLGQHRDHRKASVKPVMNFQFP